MAATAFERLCDTLTETGLLHRATGNHATARCPAHDDSEPSLSITGIDTQVLLYCHAGCDTKDVLTALGLELADLYDTRRGADYRYDGGRIVHRSPTKTFRQSATEAPPELYRLSRVQAAVTANQPVWVVEGEKDVHAIEAAGGVATCSPMGAGKASKCDWSPLAGARVKIVADRDKPGLAHAHDIARILLTLAPPASVTFLEAITGKDAADHIAAGHGLDDFAPVATQLPGPVTRRLSEVTPERVRWLWPGRLPLGKLVVLDGDPSIGKSTLTIDWLARVSTGSTWPDTAPCPKGGGVLMSAEDGLADTIRPRVDAAGGNPQHVVAFTEIRYLAEDGSLRARAPKLTDLAELETVIRDAQALLVIVDVLMAYLPRGTDSHKDQDIRTVLAGLAGIAERAGACIVLLRHLTKSHNGNPLYAGGGSIGITGAARAGLIAAADPNDDSATRRRVLAATKSNLAPMPDALAYQLVDSPEHGCARVEWLGTHSSNAHDLLTTIDPDEKGENDEAVDWLLAYLADNGGQAFARDIIKAAQRDGINQRRLTRIRQRAGVTTAKSGFGGAWVWNYPEPTLRTALAKGASMTTHTEKASLSSSVSPSVTAAEQLTTEEDSNPIPKRTPAATEEDRAVNKEDTKEVIEDVSPVQYATRAGDSPSPAPSQETEENPW